ncbi:hypothetical protein GHT06_003725 [Daphnia sinensis]|uniref:Uncharacterized protein n=1 Tax=Daphnia sinensis TaxID=1820382 RepID=A0AAD5PLP8_9CRUS|nr:hypothetical protein GHT06_003725 [Daphnia sinensis]
MEIATTMVDQGEELTGIDNPSTPANPNGEKTNPLNVDSDGDVYQMPQEALDDCDNDGLKNAEEILLNTDPLNPDTDGDGNPDKTDPNPNVPTAVDDEFDVHCWIPYSVNILANDDYLANDGNTITQTGGTALGTILAKP